MAIGTGAALIGGAIIGAVSASSSASKGAKASKSAAKIQERGVQAGISEERRQFEITQANLQSFQQAGTDAIEQQRILLGLGSSETDPNAERRQKLETQISALTRLADLPPSTGPFGNFNAQERLQSLQSELESIPAFSKISAQEAQAQAFAKLQESPGQQFLRKRAQRNLVRNASAIGGLGGGNVRSALVEQGVGFAAQDLQNQFGRLGQLAGQGQAATTSVGQFGAQSAGNIANLNVAGSQARASGILGAQQARAQGQEQVAQFAGTALSALAQK